MEEQPTELCLVPHRKIRMRTLAEQLGEKVVTLAQKNDRITSAMDELLRRAWT